MSGDDKPKLDFQFDTKNVSDDYDISLRSQSGVNWDLWDGFYKRNKDMWTYPTTHPMLLKYIDTLTEGCGGPMKILMPLCGRTYDLKWLYDHGHEVVGLEISVTAIQQFAEHHKITFHTRQVPVPGFPDEKCTVYHTEDNRLRYYCMNMFFFTPEMDGGKKFDAIWDRAGAGPTLNRADFHLYVKVVTEAIKPGGKFLFESHEFDNPFGMKGPPHSMMPDEIEKAFGPFFDIKEVERCHAPEPLYVVYFGQENAKKCKFFDFTYYIMRPKK